jgi:hypothetical protein
MATTQNYTLGRGKLHFSRFKTGTQTPEGFRYIGNTPEFNLTIESENLDHFSSDYGIREKDDSVLLEVNRSGTMITDNIDPENIALFFLGAASVAALVAASGLTEDIDDVKLGHGYKLGQSASNPAGYFGINPAGFSVYTGSAPAAATATITFSDPGDPDDTVTIGGQVYTLKAAPANPFEVDIGGTASDTADNLAAAINAGAGSGTAYGAGTIANSDVTASASAGVVTITARTAGTAGNSITLAKNGSDITVSGATLSGGTGTAFVLGTDYEMDFDTGLLTPLDGGAISEGADLTVSFAVRQSTRERVISGATPVEGALMFVAANPKGKQFNYYFPWIKITPNGDYALKGDEWQQIPFNLEILKPSASEAIFMDGKPAYT